MAFSGSDAAFEGFRLVRRNPMALVAWALLYAALSLGSLFAMAGATDTLIAWGERMEALESASPTTEEVLAAFQGMGEVMLSVAWLLPVSIAVSAAMTCSAAW